jgi:hypothetical protein
MIYHQRVQTRVVRFIHERPPEVISVAFATQAQELLEVSVNEPCKGTQGRTWYVLSKSNVNAVRGALHVAGNHP